MWKKNVKKVQNCVKKSKNLRYKIQFTEFPLLNIIVNQIFKIFTIVENLVTVAPCFLSKVKSFPPFKNRC